jgi:hypothetical protein
MIAKHEDKKSKVAIGDIREILNILINVQVEFVKSQDEGQPLKFHPYLVLMNEASRRSK